MELVRVLAAGGFGIVYLARDHWLDRDVAVKEFLPTHLAGRGDNQQVELRTDADAATFAQGLQSFIAEAKLLAHFSHPAIVKVHRFWEANGTGYMVMPYLRGPTLGQVRRSMSQPPTEQWLRSIIDPLMGALAMLHAEGVYHRDIAPDNVLVTDNGLPVLLDFGAARSIGCAQSCSPTAILKPRFAPIEQYAEATRLRQGPWTDIYSLGALVAYLLEGAAPPASTARVIDDEMTPLQKRDIRGVSRTFLSAIDWALSVRPQDRPQSIAELRDALDGCALAQAFPATIHQGRPVVPPRALERVGRPLMMSLAGVALVLAVAPLAPGPLPGPVAREAARAPMHDVVRDVVLEPAVRVSTVRDPAVRDPLMSHARERPEPKLAIVPSEILAAATTDSTMTNDARAEPLADGQRVRTTKPAVAAKAAKRAPRPAVKSYAAAPSEPCAGRGFFVRPSCMQRACKEARYLSSPQCVPFRHEARLEHS
jgi:non-specific serine/threonine protein kinase